MKRKSANYSNQKSHVRQNAPIPPLGKPGGLPLVLTINNEFNGHD